MIQKYISLILKGAALGSANVIPGVSGGTIALVTGIFERLINAIKSFDTKALKLIFKGDLKGFAQHTDLVFLIMVFGGVGVAIISLARIFEFLFANYPIHIWAFFFGLIMASVYYVGQRVEKWKTSTIISLVAGAGIALAISFINPASENSGFVYLMLCGVVAVCSMILPGLSGSFVLILMGNYELVVIEAINEMRMDILLPVLLGAVMGLIAFSHLLSWVLKHFHDQTLASLTGFIFGSLGILWPWKKDVYLTNDIGEFIIRKGEKVITGYQYYLPEVAKSENLIAFGLILAGILVIYLMEKSANTVSEKE
jgi:putative membrane protein